MDTYIGRKAIKAHTERIHSNFRIVVTYGENGVRVEWNGYKGDFNSVHNVQYYKKISNKV